MTTWMIVDITYSHDEYVTRVVNSSPYYQDIYLSFLQYHDNLVQHGIRVHYPPIHQEYFNYQMGGSHKVEIVSYRS